MHERDSADEKRAGSESRLLEISHRILHKRKKYPPFIVEKAWRHLEEIAASLLKDVDLKVIDADSAERIFIGLKHYKGYKSTKRDFNEDGPVNGVN